MLDNYRPFQAADMLESEAMRRLRLTSDGGIFDTVRALAKTHGVKLLSFRQLDTRSWDRLIADLERTPRSADIACARARLGRLEQDLLDAVTRANAWSAGNITALREDPGLRPGTERDVCEQFFQHSRFVKRAVQDQRRKSHAAYLRALKKNRSTLALVSIEDLFDTDGVLARFRQAGFAVVEP